MSKFIKMERISLKNNPFVKEDLIQNFIFSDPTVLGLGDLTPIQREKVQPSGGRLDVLLGDDNGTRYEVEIQLGATDPSHIIRTIEYWDTERKRYPQYDHCAVIVAEEITGRFMNVISLFNGNIPLIALQLSAYKSGEDIMLTFTKVIDRVSYATDEEEEFEVTDRNYWNSKSTPKMLKLVDQIFESTKDFMGDYELKYNKFYIGITKDGVAKIFIYFKPKKNFVYLNIKTGEETSEFTVAFENAGLDVSYVPRNRSYAVKINSYNDYEKNKELIDRAIKKAQEYFKLDSQDY